MTTIIEADLPEDVVAALRAFGYTPRRLSEEALKHYAGVLYGRRVLSLEQAAHLAQMSLWDFLAASHAALVGRAGEGRGEWQRRFSLAYAGSKSCAPALGARPVGRRRQANRQEETESRRLPWFGHTGRRRANPDLVCRALEHRSDLRGNPRLSGFWNPAAVLIPEAIWNRVQNVLAYAT